MPDFKKEIRKLFDTSSDIIIVLQDDYVRYANPRACRLIGYAPDELIDHAFREFVHPDDCDRVTERYEKRIKKAPIAPFIPFRLNKKSGAGLWFEVHTIETIWNNRPAILVFFYNIERRKKTEERLRESESKNRAILNAMPDMMFQLTKDGEILDFDDPMSQMSEFVKLFSRNNIHKILVPDVAERIMENMGKAFLTGKVEVFEFSYTVRGERRHYETRLVAYCEDEALAIVRDITDRKASEESLRDSSEALRRENLLLKNSLGEERYSFHNLIGHSPEMQTVYDNILKAASTSVHVTIFGESGTGKELVAKAIHDLSDRSSRNFVPVNCGAIPENLLESEFFGYRKGAFSGAAEDKEGFLDRADGGTLFMDELGEIDLNMQVKLLRAIEGGGYSPVGSSETKHSDLRIIAATNRNLVDLVKEKSMRMDFFYRINVIPIYLPPLRERGDDLTLLIYHFIKKLTGSDVFPGLSRDAMAALQNYDWPGNVRELQNVLHRYITMGELDISGDPMKSATECFGAADFSSATFEAGDLRSVMGAYEKQYILRILEANKWHKGKTAGYLKIDRKTLFRKLKCFGVI